MAGGTFDIATGKTRPGTYINFSGEADYVAGTGISGVVLLPLAGHSYGPAGEYIEINNSAPNSARALLGYGIAEKNINAMLLIGEALKNAQSVLVYILKEGTKAKVIAGNLTVTAKYGGSRGNDFKVSVVDAVTGYDVKVYLDTALVFEQEGVVNISDLNNSDWVDFSGEGALSEEEATAGTKLIGGADATVNNEDIAGFIENCGARAWNTVAFTPPFTANEYGEIIKGKMKALRDGEGKYRRAVIADFAADYEGVINVTNGVRLADGTDVPKDAAVAWVAGADAAASNTTSLTYRTYQDAVEVLGAKDHDGAVAAIKKGEFFFSVDDDMNIVVEYDINSLVDVSKPMSYRKNRVMRALDSFGTAVKSSFPPNRFSNDPTGWDIMEGVGKGLLKTFEAAGAISEVDYDNDFKIDRGASRGDSTYFNVAVKPVDSAEKLYFTITTG